MQNELIAQRFSAKEAQGKTVGYASYIKQKCISVLSTTLDSQYQGEKLL